MNNRSLTTGPAQGGRRSHLWRRFLPVLLALLGLLAACRPADLPYSADDLPAGEPARGATLFTTSLDGAPPCSACHALSGSGGSGPSLEGYGARAGDRVDGQSALEYSFYSLLRPAKHLVRGYSNTMYADYVDRLSQQDVADLIAYLHTL
jgi:mono/diheme cytochrome c family protein